VRQWGQEVDDMAEAGFRRRPRILDLIDAGGMPEAEAREIAEASVRHARSDAGRVLEGPAPNPDEVRERRESRARRESRQES
jgi:hypothetical protein